MKNEKVMVMNEKTWSGISESIISKAEKFNNPIEFVEEYFKGITVIIDQELDDNFVEVYEKDVYDEIKKLESGEE